MFRKFYLAVVVLIIMGGILSMKFAFSAQADSSNISGEGISQVSGIVVANVHYSLLASNPNKIAAIEFDVKDFQGTIKVQLDPNSGNLFSCNQIAKNRWGCDVQNINITDVNSLRVVAFGN
jgi:hypothetical protein